MPGGRNDGRGAFAPVGSRFGNFKFEVDAVTPDAGPSAGNESDLWNGCCWIFGCVATDGERVTERDFCVALCV